MTILETKRLILREMMPGDFAPLYEILSDPEIMAHYPAPFDAERVRGWIQRNLERYARDGFGLWAVVLRDTGAVIGDCGLTMQEIDGEMLPEIGYHIHKRYWRRGYAHEAAAAVRDWAFAHTAFDCLYAYMKYTNAASCAAAASVGMEKVREYPDIINRITCVYAITRAAYERRDQ